MTYLCDWCHQTGPVQERNQHYVDCLAERERRGQAETVATHIRLVDQVIEERTRQRLVRYRS